MRAWDDRVATSVDAGAGKESGPILTVFTASSSQTWAAQWAKAMLGTAVDGLPVKLQLNCDKSGTMVTYAHLYDAPDVTELVVVGVKARDRLRTLLKTLSISEERRTPMSCTRKWPCPKLRRFSIFHSSAIDPRDLRRMVEARSQVAPTPSHLSNRTLEVELPVPITEFRVGGGPHMDAGQWKEIEGILGPGATCELIQDEDEIASAVGGMVEADDDFDY